MRRDVYGPTTTPHGLTPLCYHSHWAFLCAGPSCIIAQVLAALTMHSLGLFSGPLIQAPTHGQHPCFAVA